MFCRVLSAGIEGISAYMVNVEADVTAGLPGFQMVGLLSSEVRESKDRVLRAVFNSGISIPSRKITINLAPADKRKSGTGFDLAIAVSVLVCLGFIKESAVQDKVFAGELSLDGRINPVYGILPICMKAKQEGISTVIVPYENVFEGAAITGIKVFGVKDLKELIHALNTDSITAAETMDLESRLETAFKSGTLDFKDISGQEKAKRATMVAVAGFHHLLYIGPPGSGKSMLAARIPSILNRLTVQECLEISTIYSVAGLLHGGSLILNRPFRSPHHSISPAALSGGGMNPRPGEITLAHKGILFLDEAAEFKRDTLDLLRQPIEEKQILLARAGGHVVYPADFMLVMAANPCKCGFFPDRKKCSCTTAEVKRYFGKLNGPVLDRIDICAGISKPDLSDLYDERKGMSSALMREKVLQAQKIQHKRFQKMTIKYNAQMGRGEIEKFCILEEDAKQILNKAYESFDMTARGYYKTLKIARTIADIEGCEKIYKEHILEAVSYKNAVTGMNSFF